MKGARQFGFDHLTELLVKKVHETVLEVNLNAVVDNLNWYRSFLKPETKIGMHDPRQMPMGQVP